jgi:hypothetical protein
VLLREKVSTWIERGRERCRAENERNPGEMLSQGERERD